VAAVRSTFLTAEEMRAKMAAVARGTRAAGPCVCACVCVCVLNYALQFIIWPRSCHSPGPFHCSRHPLLTPCQDQPISFAEAQRVAGIFSGLATAAPPPPPPPTTTTATSAFGPGPASTRAQSAWTEPAMPSAASTEHRHHADDRVAGPPHSHPSDETFVIGPSPHAARTGNEGRVQPPAGPAV
jgi:hypothetical protein